MISPIEEIIEEMRLGKMVIIVDEADRENEGDLIISSGAITPEAINFMAKFGRGLVCLTLTEKRCRQLDLRLMVNKNGTRHGTAFTVSIEAARGVTTGISAYDRALTIQAAVASGAVPDDIVQPGHVFPLMAQEGGVLVRAGHTEAGSDLAYLAGYEPSSVICEIMNDDGSMARLPELERFADMHGIKIGTISDLIQYRSSREQLVNRLHERDFIGKHGAFRLFVYEDTVNDVIHFALVKGDISPENEVLVRVHQPLCSLDWLDFQDQPYSYSLRQAMEIIENQGEGVLVILHRKETKDDLMQLINAAKGGPQRPMAWNHRLYGTGAQILKDLGIGKMRIMGSVHLFPNVSGFGLEVTGFYSDTNQNSASFAKNHP